jgi:hypothetical protein
MKLIHPKHLGLTFLVGFLIGMLIMTLSAFAHAQTAKKHPAKHSKTHKTALASHSKKTHVASHKSKSIQVAHKAKTHPKVAKKPATSLYMHPEGFYTVRYPASWRVNAKENAMLVKSNGTSRFGVFGIVRRDDSNPNEEAVKHELAAPNRPADLTEMPARVAGLPATKIVGSAKENPDNRMVEYYVQHPDGRQYYILMMAPRNQWNQYNVAFNSMLQSLSFN